MSRSRLRETLGRLDRATSALAFRRYDTARLYTLARLRLAPRRAPILIYTVGKVGSSTVADSLAASGLDASIYHLHWLRPDRLAKDERLQREAAERYRGTPLEAHFRPRYVWRGQFLAPQLGRPPQGGGRWKVITLVRDPLARNVSSFFQNLPLLDYDYRARLAARSEAEVVEELLALFERSYLGPGGVTDVDGDPLTWFDQELAPVFGVDVYQRSFPIERGFDLYDSSTARVLLLRLEDLDRCAPAAFREFLGLQHFSMRHQQIAEDKAYASLYRRFRAALRVPDAALDRIYGSRYARHFYTQAELEGFRARLRGAS